MLIWPVNRLICYIIFAIWVLSGSSVNSQELQQRTIFEKAPAFRSSELKKVDFRAAELVAELESSRSELEKAAALADWGAVDNHLSRLILLRWQLGGVLFRQEALTILEKLKPRLVDLDQTDRFVLSDRIWQLAPGSAEVAYRLGLLLLEQGDFHSALGYLFRAVLNCWNDPLALANLIASSFYPVLLSLGLAFYLVFAAVFAYQIRLVMFVTGRFFPWSCRGIAAPVLSLAVLLAPLYFGLIWTVFVWAAVYIILLGRSAWVSFFCSCWLIALALLIPLRETLTKALSDPEAVQMLAVAGGQWGGDKLDSLANFARQWPDHGIGYYSLALAQISLGDNDGAESSLISAAAAVPEKYSVAQQGIIAFQRDQIGLADQKFAQATSLGLREAGHLYNHSRVKFELLDSAVSRDLLRLARLRNKRLTQDLIAQEEISQGLGGMALQQNIVPAWITVQAAFAARPESRVTADQAAARLMPGLNCLSMALAGMALLALFLVWRSDMQRLQLVAPRTAWEDRVFEPIFAVLPGGAYLKSLRPGWTVLCLWSFAFLLMPLFGWPARLGDLFFRQSELLLWYLVGLAFLLLLEITVLALFSGSRIKEKRFERPENVSWNY